VSNADFLPDDIEALRELARRQFAERDLLVAERDAVSAERDAAVAERDRAVE
jgi:hypothetical protein